jgi:uncharacterized protein (UPF0335 family)
MVSFRSTSEGKVMTNTALVGHNSDLTPEQLADINRMTNEIFALENERGSINDDISSLRKQIKAIGIDMTAWAAAMKRKKMDMDQRAEFDRSQNLCNQAFGIPFIQGDLFEDVDQDDDTGADAE